MRACAPRRLLLPCAQMALVDERTIHVAAGRGGDGVVRWRREKYKEFGGPAGGDGGKGGDVIVRGVRDISYLGKYQEGQQFRAEDGASGRGASQHGKNGKDLVIFVPVGSVLTHVESGRTYEIVREGEEVVVARGGRGGFGNEHFKSATNQAPKEATRGGVGERGTWHIELRLIADAGLVGLPNAGKTSLLNVLTNARRKVGAYAFTTLEPALGVHYDIVLADIPGLIEGAAQGKGLGHAFLRHIARTRVLVHCVSLEEEDPARAYRTVRREIAAYNPALAAKREILVLTKSDTVTPEAAAEAAARMRRVRAGEGPVLAVSILDDDSLKELSKALHAVLKEEDSSASMG